MYAIFLFTVAAYRDSCRLFVREDVLIDLDGVEFAVGEVVVLLGFGAIGVPFVFLDADRTVAVVVLDLFDHFAGDIIVGTGDAPFLAVGGILDLLDTASLAVIDLEPVHPSGFGLGVGVPFLDRQVFLFLAFGELLRREEALGHHWNTEYRIQNTDYYLFLSHKGTINFSEIFHKCQITNYKSLTIHRVRHRDNRLRGLRHRVRHLRYRRSR